MSKQHCENELQTQDSEPLVSASLKRGAGGPVYFGVDLFYPGGWTGAINDQSRLIQKNQNILGPSWNMYKDIGGY